jgi:hypothetical protein
MAEKAKRVCILPAGNAYGSAHKASLVKCCSAAAAVPAVLPAPIAELLAHSREQEYVLEYHTEHLTPL